jgi:hypothetical protein
MLFFGHSRAAPGAVHRVAWRSLRMGYLFPAAGAYTVAAGAGTGAVASHAAPSLTLPGRRTGSISSGHS